MTLKTILAAAAIALFPALAIAACFDHTEQAMSCADGMTYDTEKKACVLVAS
ncbi:adenylosuccinate lyase [Mameliella alba]|nr:adenylosuccinate lyase [Antarctobacter heliothermus]MBY6145564.1 adenylosuccinate lyase [Mameliella alba]MCA0955572.1 adenylosuccinate lyase [Mameliella alba]